MRRNLIVVSMMGSMTYAVSSKIANKFFLKEEWLINLERNLFDRSQRNPGSLVSAMEIKKAKEHNDVLFYGAYGFFAAAVFRGLSAKMMLRMGRRGTLAPRMILSSISFIPFYFFTGFAFNESLNQILRKLSRDFLIQSVPLTLLIVLESYAMILLARVPSKSTMTLAFILSFGLLNYLVSTVYMMTLCRPEYKHFLKA